MVRYYSELKKEIFVMEKVYSNKINLLKALAIKLVVSGHLEFSLFKKV